MRWLGIYSLDMPFEPARTHTRGFPELTYHFKMEFLRHMYSDGFLT